MLDRSVAFTIDNPKLLHLSNQSLEIKCAAPKWFESYLKNRTHSVRSRSSTPVTLRYGVPQCFVLGPTLFTMCKTLLENIIRRHRLSFHLFADDTHIYIYEATISRLEACIKDINIWMPNNLLKFNDDKTDLFVITTHNNTSQNQHIAINTGDSLNEPSGESPMIPGLLFDTTCGLNYHVSKICNGTNFNLYSVGKIRKYLNNPTTEKIINCSITQRMDNDNRLL